MQIVVDMDLQRLLTFATVAAFVTTASCKSEKLTTPMAPASATAVAEAEPPPPTDRFTDAELEAALERELVSAGVPTARLDARVTLGIAELTGRVPHLLAKKRAVRVAGAIRGIRAVIDRVRVTPAMRPDAEVAADIKKTLALDPAAEAYEVKAAVSNGVVTLSGEVDSWQERQLAESLAMQVKGVVRVTNEIEVDVAAERTDHDIREDVESRLRWDVLVDHRLIGVSVTDGHVSLAGMVGSVAEKLRAAADAWVAGAVTVDIDALDIDWLAADAYRRSSELVAVSDPDIRQAIIDAMLFDPRVKSYRVDVAVTNGEVTLDGAVPNLRARRAAGRIAEQTTGVLSVTNDIDVKPEGAMNDIDLQRSIAVALALNPITESHEIAATVDGGTATLRGTVDSFFERAEATSVAMRVDGVHAVVNQLDVRVPTGAFVYERYAFPDYPDIDLWELYVPTATNQPDRDIEAQIMEELLFDPDVDLYQIEVSVSNGVATLSGTVDSRFESLQAELNARQGGATGVVNKLEIRR